MLIGFNINDHDVTLMGKYIEWPPNRNHRMRNRMYGGVRDQ